MASAIILLCTLLLVPLTMVDVPPLLDYPNHLARAYVLAFGAGDPVVSRMYAAHWSIIPNLGIDLVLPPLLHVLPTWLAGRVVLGIAILLPVLGTIAFARAAFGTPSAWPLASGLVAYNAALLLGFINFVAAVGLALLLAAAWIAWRERYPARTIALAAIGTVVLFFCHLMGLLFFYILIGGGELMQLWQRRTDLSVTLRRAIELLPLLILPLGLYLLSPLASVAGKTEFASPPEKLRELIFPFANYVLPLDIATGLLVVAVPVVCALTRRCRVTPGTSFALAVVAGLFLAMPWAFKGTYFLDVRFAIMFGFLLFGAVLPHALPRSVMLVLIAGFALLFATRIAVICFAWDDHRQDLAALRSTIAEIEPGTRVFVASVAPEEAPQYWRDGPISRVLSNGIRVDYHTPALLLIEHRAFWPFLFDNPSQQPVTTLEPYRTLAAQARSVPNHTAVAEAGKVDLCGYDDLLLLEAGGEPDLTHFAADRLTLHSRSDFAALFRIKDANCASASRHENRQSPPLAPGSTDRSDWPTPP